jgi:uncharacterized protein DUF6265
MLGTLQITENDKTLVLELFALTETPEGVELRIRHFTPSLTPWENAVAVLRFASSDPKSQVFENPSAGDPQRAIFQKVDADTYVSRSEIVAENGDRQISEITYRRQKEPPPSRRR